MLNFTEQSQLPVQRLRLCWLLMLYVNYKVSCLFCKEWGKENLSPPPKAVFITIRIQLETISPPSQSLVVAKLSLND